MRIDITTAQTKGKVPVTVLQPHGELDASNYQELIEETKKVWAEGARDIVLDLGQVSYMSSSGLVALQSVASLLRGEALPDPESGWEAFHAVDRDRDLGAQSHLRLCSPQPRVDRVLEIVGFKQFLEVHPDLETALASF